MECYQCAYPDVPQYKEEAPICPACGTIIVVAEPSEMPWLTQWPAHRRSAVAQPFYRLIRAGITDLAAVVEEVEIDLRRRLQWLVDTEKRQFWCQVLEGLHADPLGGRAFALAVLLRESLPPAERERQKQERAQSYIKQAMQGKPTTEKQRMLLRSLGHRGECPADRLEASRLIDTYLRKKGGAA